MENEYFKNQIETLERLLFQELKSLDHFEALYQGGIEAINNLKKMRCENCLKYPTIECRDYVLPSNFCEEFAPKEGI